MLLSAGLFGLGAGAGAGPASATSCRPPPRPIEVVTGATYGDGKPYLAPGDYAVIGRVTALELLPEPTATAQRSGWEPRYRVRMAVSAYFGGTAPGDGIELGVVDRGEMYGYPFRVGGTYFVPVKRGGELPPISLCAAVAPLTGNDVDAYTTTLIDAAAAKGVPAGRIRAPGPVPADVPVRDGGEGGTARLALAGLAGAGLAVPLTLLAARLRSRRAARRGPAAPAEPDQEGSAGSTR